MYSILQDVKRSYLELEATVNFLIESYQKVTLRKGLQNAVKYSMIDKTRYLEREKLISHEHLTMFNNLADLKQKLEETLRKTGEVEPYSFDRGFYDLRLLMFDFTQLMVPLCQHLTNQRMRFSFPFRFNTIT